ETHDRQDRREEADLLGRRRPERKIGGDENDEPAPPPAPHDPDHADRQEREDERRKTPLAGRLPGDQVPRERVERRPGPPLAAKGPNGRGEVARRPEAV